MFESPCPYVPASKYDWKLVTPYVPPPGCSNLPWNPLIFCLDVSFQACTIWMALELNVQIFSRFKRRTSLYFWSMLISTWGTLFFAGGELLAHYSNHEVAATVVLNIGWVAMVTGFSFVLYSRLHLLQPKRIILKAILTCIIVDGIIFHGPTIVATIIVNVRLTATSARVYEDISFTEIAFSVQETVLASLYIYFFLQYTVEMRDALKTRSMLRLLIGAEIVVLSMDIALNSLLYTKVYLARIMIQAFMSVLKLKIEFVVLNSLVDYAQHRSLQTSSISMGQTEVAETPRISMNPGTWMAGKTSEVAVTGNRMDPSRGISWNSSRMREPLGPSSTAASDMV